MNNKIFLLSLIFSGITSFYSVFAQNTVITDDAGYTANPSAMLDVNSANKGFLVPRVTTLQMNEIVPAANGLLVYNTNLNSFCYRADGKWIVLASQLLPQSAGITDALFHVVNAAGDTVFAVYPEGVRISVGNGLIKGSGNKGGFAVGGFSSGKSYQEFMRVTNDSVRIYINENAKGSGNKGGFAVGGFSGGKGLKDYMVMTPSNYFIGHQSGMNIKTGLYNSFMGYQAGMTDTSGGYNTFIGYRSGYSNASGSWNAFMGFESGFSNTSGDWNLFMGYKSGYSNTTGQRNVFLGDESGYSNKTAVSNVFIGYASGYTNSTGGGNAFMGEQSGFNNNGSWNTFLGAYAGSGNNSGGYNVFVGGASGQYNVSGASNAFVGNNSGINSIGSENVYLGSGAGAGNYPPELSERNVCIGYRAGAYISGNDNVFIGYNAGYNTTGSHKLIIHNDAFSLPLIYGEFNNRKMVFNSRVTIDRFLALNDTAQVLSANGTIQPYTSYIKVSSTSDVILSVTSSIGNGSVIGQVIMIQNSSTFNITVKNSANTKLGGSADKILGANDMLMLIWDGTDWIQYSYSDN